MSSVDADAYSRQQGHAGGRYRCQRLYSYGRTVDPFPCLIVRIYKPLKLSEGMVFAYRRHAVNTNMPEAMNHAAEASTMTRRGESAIARLMPRMNSTEECRR